MESRNFYLISRVFTPDHAPSSSLEDFRGGVGSISDHTSSPLTRILGRDSISDHAPSPNSYFVCVRICTHADI